FTGTESTDGIISNSQLSHSLFGYPRVSIHQLIDWTADWIMQGEARLGKPTHFETRHGKY
ncbi:MAG: epimerase, partial [bacterium]|nr:epimerase [bacterium]